MYCWDDFEFHTQKLKIHVIPRRPQADVGIRFPLRYKVPRVTLHRKITDCHDQSADWSRNDVEFYCNHFGMVMVRTIWLSVSRRSDTAGIPDSWIRARY